MRFDIYTNQVILADILNFAIDYSLLAFNQVGYQLLNTDCQYCMHSVHVLVFVVNPYPCTVFTRVFRRASPHLNESGKPALTIHSACADDIVDSAAINQETTTEAYRCSKGRSCGRLNPQVDSFCV